MDNLQKAIDKYTTPDKVKTYGSIDKGLEVLAYRNKLFEDKSIKGTYAQRAKIIDLKVIKKFGKPH